MRFIDKIEACTEFETYIADNKQYLGKWNLPTNIKNTLHNHILKQQKGLCIYCQKQLFEKKGAEYLPPSMIEHIRPRELYQDLTYDFYNLSVACKKYIQKEEPIDLCEDKKDDEYNEKLFLHPHKINDIESYFEYDADGHIFAKSDDEKKAEKANYMIKTVLNLDHIVLQNMRKTQFEIYAERLLSEVIEELSDTDVNQLPAFYSMLKYLYQI
jgi:uncharacterized protein (TIGR02646 family)